MVGFFQNTMFASRNGHGSKTYLSRIYFSLISLNNFLT